MVPAGGAGDHEEGNVMGYWEKKEPAPQAQEQQEDSLEALESDCLADMGEVEK